MSESVQIHHVRTVHRYDYVEDQYGQMQRRPVDRFIRSDTDRIAHPDAGTFEVSPDGSFYVPVEVAQHFLRMPDWHEGPSPFAPEPVAETPRAKTARKPVGTEA